MDSLSPHLEILRKQGNLQAPSEVILWEPWERPESGVLCQGSASPDRKQAAGSVVGQSMRAGVRWLRGESRLELPAA